MGDETSRRLAALPSAVVEDLLGHLRELFNVRQGSVPARPDYGMVDINDVIHHFPDAVDVLRGEIRRQIETFEPRLRDVTVRHIEAEDQGTRMIFAVSGVLTDGAQRLTIEAEVGDNGFVQVAG